MKKPDTQLEAEFNKGGIFFLPERSIKEIATEGNWVGVEVDLDVLADAEVLVPDFSMSVLNKRGVAVIVSDWTLSPVKGDRKTLSFQAWLRCGASAYRMINDSPSVAMSFLDFCFNSGNEALPEGFKPDTFTEPREGWKLGDMGWLMPVRMADPMIDALGKINDSVLSGMLQEAILYGVLTR